MTNIPQTIGNYRIERLLGSGGMADVYLATHQLLNKPFAIKVMKGQAGIDDPVMAKRFIREAQLAQKVEHPNVVRVFDVGTDAATGMLYIVMEYVEGENLSDYSRGKMLSSQRIREIAYEMTKALIAFHDTGIVHRDIKPSNIMLCKDGAIKLMDLGIAKNLQTGKEGEATLTMEQAVLGTPAYASPEQCLNAKSVDIRSDIYCLGASLYAIASGRPPYGGTTAMEILLKVVEDTPQPLAEIRKDLDPNLISLIEWMMEKSPEKRPQTPQELLAALVSGRFTRRRNGIGIAVMAASAIVLLVLFGLLMTHLASKAKNGATAEHGILEKHVVDANDKPKKETESLQKDSHEADIPENARQSKTSDSGMVSPEIVMKKEEAFYSPEKKGTFTFDYSNNNGEYVIGEGDALFRTRWSKASNKSIWAYKDGKGMAAIACLKDVVDIEAINTSEGDFSNRYCKPKIGDAIVWKNDKGKYAITKVVSIKDNTRGSERDELTCDYIVFE